MAGKLRLVVVLGVCLVVALPGYGRKRDKNTLGEVTVTATAPKVEPRRGFFDLLKLSDGYHFVVGDSLLGRPFLSVTRFVGAPADAEVYGGEVSTQTLLYWQLSGGKMLLRQVSHVNEADTATNIALAVAAASEDAIIAAFKVVKSETDTLGHTSYRFNVGGFLGEDNLVTGVSQSRKEKLGITGFKSELSYVDTVQTFPRNVVVQAVKTYSAKSTAKAKSAKESGLVTFRLSTSFLALPEHPMRPRIFDRRVGYFTVASRRFADSEPFVEPRQYVTRWRLEPRTAADSVRQLRGEAITPRTPITFYLDPAIPTRLQPYIKAGVEDWNAAFAEAGWRDAVVCRYWREAPSDTAYGRPSMEDARFNMVRLLASPAKNAYGPQINDPRTGEILTTNICIYHNVVALLHDWYTIQAGALDPRARQKQYEEALLGRLLRYVVCHEVGHTLGLRHNMGASSCTPVDSLRNADYLRRWGHSASIMDYCRLDYAAQPEDNIPAELLVPRLGDYDLWAIRWGYASVAATDAEAERLLLSRGTTEMLNRYPRLWFGGEGTDGDPRAMSEDLGDDPLRANELGLLNLKRLAPQLAEWSSEPGDDYRRLRELLNALVSQHVRFVQHATLMLGGVRHEYKTVEQPGAVYRPAPSSETRAAIEFVRRHALMQPDWLLSLPYLDRLTPNPQKLFEVIAEKAVKGLCSTTTVARISQTDGRGGSIRPEEYIGLMVGALYAPLKGSAPLTSWQRLVMRLSTQQIAACYEATHHTEARTWWMLALQEAQGALRRSGQTDSGSRAHVADLLRDIALALETTGKR